MKQEIKQMRKVSQAGFSLIELLVVLVILGLLVSVVAPNVLDRLIRREFKKWRRILRR